MLKYGLRKWIAGMERSDIYNENGELGKVNNHLIKLPFDDEMVESKGDGDGSKLSSTSCGSSLVPMD